MRIRKINLKSSFFNLLGYGEATPSEPPVMALEELREVMLSTLGEAGSVRHPLLARRIRYARDAEGLWYARSDLMAVLAELHGESQARREMDALSLLFCGVLPAGMTARLPRTTT